MASANFSNNVAVIGMTGVGKSSLINYLYGKVVAKSGLWVPQTQKGFHIYNLTHNNFPVTLYDSWGLEVNSANEWKLKLDDELKFRGTKELPEEWFHTILYCINAGGNRYQDVDNEIIMKLLSYKCKVIVIVTHADIKSKAAIAGLTDLIRKKTDISIPVIPVCTVSSELMGGQITKTFGKKEILDEIRNNFWDTIITRLPEHCCLNVKDYLEDWKIKQIKEIKERANKGDSLEDIQQKLNQSWDKKAIPHLVEQKISHTFDVYASISKIYDHSYYANSIPEFDGVSLGNKYFKDNKSTTDKKSSSRFAAIGSAISQYGLLSNVGTAAIANASAPLAGFFGLGGGGIMGAAIGTLTVATTLIPVVNTLSVLIPIISVVVAERQRRLQREKLQRQLQQLREEAIESLIDTVTTEIDNCIKQLYQLESAIADSLIKMRSC